MSSSPADRHTQELAAQAIAQGDPTAWFDQLYREADGGSASVPWDRGGPSELAVEWLAGRSAVRPDGSAQQAMVIGCGYGRDAEYVAGLGFATTAFDISPAAIDGARARHPASPVHYEVADLMAPPDAWRGVFDLVLESRNVHALPPELHAVASAAVASLLAPGGTLLVLAAIYDGSADGPPWPPTRAELENFAVAPIELVQASQASAGAGNPPGWRAEFVRPPRP